MPGVLCAALLGADDAPDRLHAIAREFSPRVERYGAREVVLDAGGLERLFGDARTLAHELRRTAADRGLRVRVAMACAQVAARLLVHHHPGITVIEPGTEAVALVTLPIHALSVLDSTPPRDGHRAAGTQEPSASLIRSLRGWGVRTLGEFAALPTDAVVARLGADAALWQRYARGDDPRPLVPDVPEERFEQSLDLEWPIEGLEPLSFVLGRLLDPLEAQLARRGRGAAVLYVRLDLVTRAVHERSLQLPAPIRDARTLRTLALLDLESHPPDAAVDRVTVAADPTPERIVQFSLITRPLPSPEQVSTLMARLTALMGEGRCGSPALVDSWNPAAFAMQPFAPTETRKAQEAGDARSTRAPGREPVAAADSGAPAGHSRTAIVIDRHERQEGVPVVALRRFRLPVPARVRVDAGRPAHVATDRRGLSGGRVCTSAGPWRTSGEWWKRGWDRDEWDVTLADGATYRLCRERGADTWFIEAVVD